MPGDLPVNSKSTLSGMKKPGALNREGGVETPPDVPIAVQQNSIQ